MSEKVQKKTLKINYLHHYPLIAFSDQVNYNVSHCDHQHEPSYLLISVKKANHVRGTNQETREHESNWFWRTHDFITNNFIRFAGSFLNADHCTAKLRTMLECSSLECQQFCFGGGLSTVAGGGREGFSNVLSWFTQPSLPMPPWRGGWQIPNIKNQLSGQHRVIAVLVKCTN